MSPLLISLKRPIDDFQIPGTSSFEPFSAAADCGTKYPNCIFLFKGEEQYRLNVRTGQFESGPCPIGSELDCGEFPLVFATGIDASTWGGPSFPELTYFFKGDRYTRFNSRTGTFDEGPSPIAGHWRSADGNWFSRGCDSVLHGVGRFSSMLHIFKGGEYIRHDLTNGYKVVGPVPVNTVFSIPEPFADGFDYAFYGAGVHAEDIYFVRGSSAILYDSATETSSDVFDVSDRIIGMRAHLPAPVLFLVERYRLNMYAGETQRGAHVSTTNVEPRKKKTVKIVTESVETTSVQRDSSVLDSQDDATVKDLYGRIDTSRAKSEGSDKSSFDFRGSFEGEYSTAVASGEASADVSAQGGSESVRNAFSEAVHGAVGSQVTETSRRLKQTVVSDSEVVETTNRTVRIETEEINNSTDKMMVYEYFQQLEPWLTMLILDRVQLAFSSGSGEPETVDIGNMSELLGKALVAEARKEVEDYIVGELSNIADYNGNPRSILRSVSDNGGTRHLLDEQIRTDYPIQQPDGTVQEVSVSGIVKSATIQLKRQQSLIGRERV
ncbi:hypothetical protein GV791_09210 [Nocardia cyriacigeorgica]|uniref:Uncharacterized protein n=1 Tax=Nocardia cyriacigeorgica TaxID=135487 RepID=A0A6P1CJY5_9NOCA|nr:hemopexin repeat-containing protein [Nocardia cyriacigeorgica]NEW32738.1 hypothetical protein [Nocardia cyriacigeorgica]